MTSAEALALVFARGGSKGLPRKNLRPLHGVPLIGRAIRAAHACDEVGRVVVSTDDEEIADTARRFGAEVPWLRPAELATDDASEWLAWRHAVTALASAEGGVPDILVSVSPTAPLRSPNDISRCIARFRQGDCDLVVTGSESRHHPAFNMVVVGDDGLARVSMTSAAPRARRQDVEHGMWDLTTVAYVTNPRYVLEADHLLSGRVALVAVPRERAIDIDDEFDFSVAECLLMRAERDDHLR